MLTHQSYALCQVGNYGAAMSSSQEAVEVLHACDAELNDVAEAEKYLALSHSHLGNYEEATKRFQDLLPA